MTTTPRDTSVTPSRDPLADRALWAIGAMAGVASFTTLYALAVRCGWSPWTAWIWPLIIDAFALVAWREWRRLSVGPARSFAARCGWGATGLSVTCNAVEHLAAWGVAGGSLRWSVFVAVVGAVPPIIVPLVVRLTDPTEIAAEAVVTGPWYSFRTSRARHAAPTPMLTSAPLVAATVEDRDALIAKVLGWARRDGLVAIIPIREAYEVSHSIAKAVNKTRRAETSTSQAVVRHQPTREAVSA